MKTSHKRSSTGKPNPIDVHVGARVRLRRTLLGMSQERLGRCIGLTFQQIQKYERGGNRIGASRLFDLSIALDVPVAYFFQEMPEEISRQSPRMLIAGCAEDPIAFEADPMLRRETLELVRAYYNISSPQIRRRVLDLARSLGSSPDGGA